ncbi:MAG: hypothetical protein J1G07_05060 [Clostridiales bacterium]|nr:hypothetical protein [Clostridiales bacterium]
MGKGWILASIGIIIAIDVAVWQYINMEWAIVLIDIGILLLCALITYLENKIPNLNTNFVNMLAYLFSKRQYDYIIKEKNINYTLLDKVNAKYTENVVLSVKKAGRLRYYGRFCWIQQDPITITSINPTDKIVTREDTKWTKTEVEFPNYLNKNDTYETGFELSNLQMNDYKKRSYLSCKVTEKIEKLVLSTGVSSKLLPINNEAIYRIEDALGRTLKEEKIRFDPVRGEFIKEIKYPRQGRKYILLWEYM